VIKPKNLAFTQGFLVTIETIATHVRCGKITAELLILYYA
jgi:hypothetical protein